MLNSMLAKMASRLKNVGEDDLGETTPKRIKYKKLFGADKKSSDEQSKASSVVTEKTIRPEAMDVQYSEIMNSTGKKYQSKREEMIADGLFIEKDGDLVPTEKYFRMKKSGELKGKYNID